jgi:NTE family protein
VRARTAFVLGGGGYLGSVQVGMLRALLERGIVPDLLVGCSAGALNAAGLAPEPSLAAVERLDRIWSEIDGDQVFPAANIGPRSIWALARRGMALGPNGGLRSLIERTIDYRHFEEVAVPLQVVATSLSTGRERWFDRGPVVDPILASAALPAVYPPVEIDGELYVDGGVVDNVPISRAVNLGCTRVFVLHVGNFDRARPTPRRPLDVLLQSFSIARNHRFLAEANEQREGVELVVLPGVDPGQLKRNDFRHARVLIDRAHAAAGAYLDNRAEAAGA